MRKGWIAVIGGLLIAGVLAVGGLGVAMAMGANNGFGPFAARPGATSQQGPYEHGWMMGDPGQHGNGHMMGPGGMMNGYGPGQGQQNQASATPVAGNAVTIQNFGFSPANLEVKTGTTVTWTNYDRAPHTVTFRDSSLKSSDVLNQGDTFSYTFTQAGVYTYYCDLHQTMVGQVTVTA
jgi:plastocyanin